MHITSETVVIFLAGMVVGTLLGISFVVFAVSKPVLWK